jgi:hypothetical protein
MIYNPQSDQSPFTPWLGGLCGRACVRRGGRLRRVAEPAALAPRGWARPVAPARRARAPADQQSAAIQFLIGGFEHGRICSMRRVSVLEKLLDISVFPSHAPLDVSHIPVRRKAVVRKARQRTRQGSCGLFKRENFSLLSTHNPLKSHDSAKQKFAKIWRPRILTP